MFVLTHVCLDKMMKIYKHKLMLLDKEINQEKGESMGLFDQTLR